MNRRRFLQALFAVPCLAAPLLVPVSLYDEVWVGPGRGRPNEAPTLGRALEMVKPGGTVYVMAGHYEAVTCPPGLSWKLHLYGGGGGGGTALLGEGG